MGFWKWIIKLLSSRDTSSHENRRHKKKRYDKRARNRGYYIDTRGYYRYKNTNKLVHRHIAHRYIYKPNKKSYSLRFSKYDVHHVNGKKLNNRSSNLRIITREEHDILHGWC